MGMETGQERLFKFQSMQEACPQDNQVIWGVRLGHTGCHVHANKGRHMKHMAWARRGIPTLSRLASGQAPEPARSCAACLHAMYTSSAKKLNFLPFLIFFEI